MTFDIQIQTVKSWNEFVEIATTEFKGRWHFRGVLDNWRLESSLERAAIDWKLPLDKLPNIERRLIREFKRAYPVHLFEIPPPKESDDLGWLALMQHYGAPTRLLDWTYSPFIAAFFALDTLLSCRDAERSAAVYALSYRPVNNTVIREMLPNEQLKAEFDRYSVTRDGTPFRAIFMQARPPMLFATPVNPFSLNERLVVQQGLFYCPGDVTRSFEENILAVSGSSRPANARKILLPRSVLDDGLASLTRMNISHSTLFPGIDGYARTLRHRIGILDGNNEIFDGTRY